MFPEFNISDRHMETNLPMTTIVRSLDGTKTHLDPPGPQDDRRLDGPRILHSVDRHRGRFDRILAALMLVPALPIIGIVWGLVKLTSRGPGFYSQRRTGRRGLNFRIHKIRTMTWNCESGTGAVWAAANDPRVTPLGRFLRATHLDELPQLFNVLNGEMALVGPRPERPEIIERLLPEIPDYLERLALLPGVTGLAQVCTGADQTIDDVRLKLKYDLLYIERKSLWLDFRIVLCTGLKMLHLNARWVRALLLPEAAPISKQNPVSKQDQAPQHQKRLSRESVR
jgi:lipopolysaccharide/colanic/teichoic acid biosynthesis glycosyltransferase